MKPKRRPRTYHHRLIRLVQDTGYITIATALRIAEGRDFDAATRASLFLDLPGTFLAFQGFLGAAGEAAPVLTLPDDPLLSGHAISAAAGTVSGSAVGRISNTLELTVQ